jgi:hypothetical protein
MLQRCGSERWQSPRLWTYPASAPAASHGSGAYGAIHDSWTCRVIGERSLAQSYMMLADADHDERSHQGLGGRVDFRCPNSPNCPI